MAAQVTDLEGGKVELHTTRLKLRGAIPGDAEYLNEAFTDSEVMRYWTQEWISKMIDNEPNGITDFIICLQDASLRPIGKIGVWSGDEIGFLLGRSQWGQGLAKEALNGILPYLFDARKMDSISADIDPRNEASKGILERFGFEVERFVEKTFEIGGEWVDSLYLRLTKESWKSITR